MPNRFARRPSPATVIASIALFVSLGGVSYGVATGSIDSREIRNSTVQSKDLKNNDVRGKDIRNGTVSGGDVGDNSLTGGDLVESSLATVPSANNAATASNAANAANANQLGGKTLRGISQWVLVSAGGNVVSGSGGITVTELPADGRYRVTFPTDVTNCGLNANGASSFTVGDGSDFSNRMVMLGRSTTAPTDVQVETINDAGAAVDNPFFLTVQC